MKLKFIIFFFLTIFLLVSCREWMIKPVHISSVDIAENINLGQSIIFRMGCATPDPCHHFSHVEVRHDNFDLWVKVYAKRDPKVYCVQILGSFEAQDRFEPKIRGTYQFHFWQEFDSRYLDKAVIVK